MISFRPGWFYRTYWDNPKSFLDWLRRELPVIPNSGGGISLTTTGTSGAATLVGSTLNIPIYSSGGGASGIDSVLAIGQALTADRTIAINGNTLHYTSPQFEYSNFGTNPVHTYTQLATSSNTRNLERVILNNQVRDVAFDRRFENSVSGYPPLNDLVYTMGWNTDSQFDGTQPSWSWRLEYQYTSTLYENHLQWSNPGLTRLYRVSSYTFHDAGSTATDGCLWFERHSSFEFRPLFVDAPYFSGSASTGVGSIQVNDASGTVGVILTADATNSIVRLSQPVGGSYANTGLGIIFTNTFFGSGGNQGQIIGAGTASALIFNNFVNNTGSVFTYDNGTNDLYFDYLPHLHTAPYWYEHLDNGSGDWKLSFRNAGGYGLNICSHNDSRVETSLLYFAPALATWSIKSKFVASTTSIASINITPGARPTTPGEGDIYQDSTDHHLYLWNGSAWKQLDN